MNEIKPEYEYLNKAFEESKTKGIIATGYNDPSTVNMSDIWTTLIQNTGRFCERYASDIVIDINMIQDDLRNLNNVNEYENIYAIGIRKEGVDGNAFLTHRLKDAYKMNHLYATCYDYYRKIFVVKLTKIDNDITCELKQLTANDIIASYKNYAETSVHYCEPRV